MIAARRGAADRLSFAVQMALLNHPGIPLATFGRAPPQLVAFMAKQLSVPSDRFDGYAERVQTATDHALKLVAVLGLRPPADEDLSLMIEAGARAAWSTETGFEIAAAIVAALRNAGILFTTRARIERTGIAGRARAQKQSYEALLGAAGPDKLGKLDALLIVDPKTSATPLARVREIATAPKADNVRGLIARLQYVRSFGIDAATAEAIHHSRFRQLARESSVSPAHLLARYAPSRRHAILAALVIELEARLIDAALDMADRMIGGSFTRGGNAKERVHAATKRDVGRLMRMFSQAIDALSLAQDGSVDTFTAVDDALGWHKLLTAQPQVKAISVLAEEDPLVRAADRWVTFRKFVPALLEAINFKAGPGSASTLAAIQVLRENFRTGRRIIPDDAAMPFKKDWRALDRKGGGIDRRLYETAVMAHVRNKWRSGEFWVEGSTNYRRFVNLLLPQNQGICSPPMRRGRVLWGWR